MLRIALMSVADYDKNRPFLMEGFCRIHRRKLSDKEVEAYDEKIRKGATAVFMVSDNIPYPFAFFTIDFFYRGSTLIARVTDGYNSGERVDNLLEIGLEKAKEYAIIAGAKSIEFSSHRKGWLRRAKQLGASIVSTTYEVSLDV